jgi:hypothetical protein
VILNAPNSTVGRTLLQLCKLLKLRAVAVLRCKPGSGAAAGAAAEADDRFESVAEQLLGLGATLVLRDEGSVKVSMCTVWVTGFVQLGSCCHSSRSSGHEKRHTCPNTSTVPVYNVRVSLGPSGDLHCRAGQLLYVAAFAN